MDIVYFGGHEVEASYCPWQVVVTEAEIFSRPRGMVPPQAGQVGLAAIAQPLSHYG